MYVFAYGGDRFRAFFFFVDSNKNTIFTPHNKISMYYNDNYDGKVFHWA